MYPRIYLAIDNCFASKRWSTPADWMKVISDAGIYYVEASADNECDPLYSGTDFLKDWCSDVRAHSADTGVRIANLYSGHGTYATLGLADFDTRVRDRIQHQWLEAMIRSAAALNAGLGFFCHAFDQHTLQEPELYKAAVNDLRKRFAELASYAKTHGVNSIGVEQMYTPHQVPWTIESARRMLRWIHQYNGSNFYLTIDTGHQSGQYKFRRPMLETIREAMETVKADDRVEHVYLGCDKAYQTALEMAEKGESAEKILDAVAAANERYPYLFSTESDSDTYSWLSELGCFSPIVHLQQTDGKSSAHQPFDEKCNAAGIIKGEKLLPAIAEAYRRNFADMPEKCPEICLTLEVFAGTAELPVDILNKVKDSAAYWRQFIPEDGMPLDELLKRL